MPAFLSAPRNNVLNTDLFWAAYSIEYLANIQRMKLSSFVLQYFFNLYYLFGPVSGAALTRALCHELIRGCLHCKYFQQTNTIISKRAPNHQDLRKWPWSLILTLRNGGGHEQNHREHHYYNLEKDSSWSPPWGKRRQACPQWWGSWPQGPPAPPCRCTPRPPNIQPFGFNQDLKLWRLELVVHIYIYNIPHVFRAHIIYFVVT